MMSKFSHSVSFLTLAFLLSPLSDVSVDARWGEEDEANVECVSKKIRYKVNEDGTWTCEEDLHLRILTEAGRENSATHTIIYSATRNKLEVLEASTNNSGTVFIVPKERMEDKPLASDPLGLRKDHQILVPFERVTVGSVLHLKTKHHFFKPDFEKYFAGSLDFSGDCLWKEFDLTVESKLPLF